MSDTKGQLCSTSQEAQTASVRSLPSTAGGHNNPEMKPVAGMPMTGVKTK